MVGLPLRTWFGLYFKASTSCVAEACLSNGIISWCKCLPGKHKFIVVISVVNICARKTPNSITFPVQTAPLLFLTVLLTFSDSVVYCISNDSNGISCAVVFPFWESIQLTWPHKRPRTLFKVTQLSWPKRCNKSSGVNPVGEYLGSAPPKQPNSLDDCLRKNKRGWLSFCSKSSLVIFPIM